MEGPASTVASATASVEASLPLDPDELEELEPPEELDELAPPDELEELPPIGASSLLLQAATTSSVSTELATKTKGVRIGKFLRRLRRCNVGTRLSHAEIRSFCARKGGPTAPA
jgi:hypothetical protein